MVKRSGFGMVEVIVAMTLLGIGVMSVAGSAAFAARLLRTAEARERAARRAEQIMDSLIIGAATGAGERLEDALQFAWTVDSSMLTMKVLSVPDTTVVSLWLELRVSAPAPVLPDTVL